jgi:pyruvate dehydrogenase E1 component beta subunit
MRHRAVEAADLLSYEQISAEVIDPRTLIPFDLSTVSASVAKTSRLIVVQEGPAAGGWAATLVAQLVSERFDLFDAPPALVTSDPTPVPYAEEMERAWLPDAAVIAGVARRLLAY